MRVDISRTSGVFIRLMIRRDLKEVVDIESRSILVPWTEGVFTASLRMRNCIGMVAQDENENIIGHMIYELHRTKIYLARIAVDPDARRRKVATQLIDKLKGKLSYQRRCKIELLSRETEKEFHLFLRNQGFKCNGVIPEYFPHIGFAGQYRDAYSFEYSI